jgi:hypothetical protein
MEIAGEPEAGAVVFSELPAAEFLCPVVTYGEDAMREGGCFDIESEDE